MVRCDPQCVGSYEEYCLASHEALPKLGLQELGLVSENQAFYLPVHSCIFPPPLQPSLQPSWFVSQVQLGYLDTLDIQILCLCMFKIKGGNVMEGYQIHVIYPRNESTG